MMISITDNYSALKHVYLKIFMHSRIHLDRVILGKMRCKTITRMYYPSAMFAVADIN